MFVIQFVAGADRRQLERRVYFDCPGSGPPATRVPGTLVTVSVNGKPVSLDAPVTHSDLLEHLGLAGRKVAVECNGAIVPRSRLSLEPIADGDVIEIVVAVGGG
jgi:sulfur carrier protein